MLSVLALFSFMAKHNLLLHVKNDRLDTGTSTSILPEDFGGNSERLTQEQEFQLRPVLLPGGHYIYRNRVPVPRIVREQLNPRRRIAKNKSEKCPRVWNPGLPPAPQIPDLDLILQPRLRPPNQPEETRNE